MPELPEVETVVRLVAPALLGREFCGVRASWRRTIGGLSPQALARRLRGARVTRVWRRAKYIVIDLERDGLPAGWLRAHLRMSGRMHVAPVEADLGPYVRAVLALDDGNALHFVDVRKFGRLEYVEDLARGFAKLGPEPLDPAFTSAWLACALAARRRALKPLLLDQAFLAGLGNIYVDEALHRARLHPLTPSHRLPRGGAGRLHAEVRATLEEAILREGSSFDSFYRTPAGQPGSYQHQFQVYGRTGQPCHTCGAAIRRLVVGQRGTHLCPRCQRAPR
jgi:formamidopyrimidine-DNA glycosylase